MHIATQCLANIAAGGDEPAEGVWQATVPATWRHLLTAKAGALPLQTCCRHIFVKKPILPD